MRSRYLPLALFAILLLATEATADKLWTPYDRPAQYSVVTDQDVPIVMRDGVTLYADVRRPDAPGRFPVLVTITPYNKLIAGETPTSLVERGYVHVAVDVRGQGSSEGTWGNQNEIEQMDSYEVVEWAAVQSWSDGNVGMWGSSYRGINQLLAAALRPPSLKAVFPIVSSADNYRDYSRTGGDSNFAFVPSWLALVLAAQNVPPLWAPQDPLQVALDYLAHAGSVSSVMVPLLVERYATQMYDENRVSSPYFKLDRVGVPVFLIGGLRDPFARGEPLNYEKLRALGQVPVKLLMLDGTHTQTIAGIGLPADGVPTLEQIALRWFDRFLKGIDTGIDNIPDVTQMVRGDGHFEVQPTWPHPELQPRRLYLRGTPTGPLGLQTNRRLSSAPPSTLEPEEQFAQVYLYGYCSGSTERFTTSPDQCMNDNTLNEQTELVYTTPIFEQDVKLSGPIAANLWISTTRNEAVVSVRLTDVHPDGSSEELTFGLLAASFRAVDTNLSRIIAGENIQPWHPFSRASVFPVPPNEPMLLQIEMNPTNAVFKSGHALRISIGPSNFPSYLSPVPQIQNSAGGILSLLHDPGHPSHVVLPILRPVTWPPAW